MKKFISHTVIYSFFAVCLGLMQVAPMQTAYASQRDKPYFVLLRPDTDHPFWELCEHVMKAACADLGCNVDVKFADWDHFKMAEQAKALGAQERKPDMVFFQSYKNNGAHLIQILDEAGINSFLINAGLTQEQSAEIGKPREKMAHWVGQMMPDDFGAGAATARALYKQAKEKGYVTQEGKVLFAGIEGNSADGASIERLKGLHSVVAEYEDLELLQVVQGKWDTVLSQQLATSLMRRHADLHVIWAAGDPIAFGIVDAAKAQNPPRDILTAGVDWAPRALDEIKAGNMVGSAGGHFMEGGWAVVLAYDYVKGRDFKDIIGLESKSEMGFLDQSSLAAYTEKFGAGNFESIDFTQFSRVYHPELQTYAFGLSRVLE